MEGPAMGIEADQEQLLARGVTERQLLGAWAYGKESAPSRYFIYEDADAGKLVLTERLPTGVWVSGALAAEGEWLTAQLQTPDGKKVGMLRVRFNAEDGTAQSNVRGPTTAVWGKDIIARKQADSVPIPEAIKSKMQKADKVSTEPVKQPKPVKASAKTGETVDMLSKFFDTIEARILASEQPPDAKDGAAKQAKLPQRGGPPTMGRRPMTNARAAPPAVVAAADTAIVSALAASDPLGPFGFSVSRLKTTSGNMTCAEATVAGAPLLAIPLEKCWSTEAAKKECPKVATVLGAAAARNPKSTMLKADSTWIVLHMLHEKTAGSNAQANRKAHLALMPAAPETLLAWNSRDLQALHGSRWQEAVKQRQAQLSSDFAALTSELGPAATKELGLDLEGYTWARQVLQQLGLHFAAVDGTPMQVLVPGLELMEPDTEAPPSTEGARLEFAGGQSPMVVLYATKDYQTGSKVALSHAGLACSTGFWLLGGQVQMLDANPFEYAEIVLRFPVNHSNVSATGWFWDTVDGLEEVLKRSYGSRPGDCLPPDVAEAQPLVEMAYRRGEPELRVHLRMMKGNLLPGRMALWRLGLVVLAHMDRVDKVMKEEQAVLNPLGVDACERRALVWLQKRVEWALEESPARPEQDASRLLEGHSGDTPPRRVRGLRLVAMERQILSEALEAIAERLSAPAAPTAKVLVPVGKGEGVLARVFELKAGEEPEDGSDLGHAVAQIRGCTQALEQLGLRFQSLLSQKKLSEADGKALLEELAVLQNVLAGSPLKPTSAKTGQAHFTSDVVIKACAEANKAELTTSLASLEWAAAAAEKAGQKDKLSKALVSSAKVRAKLLDFKAAHGDLKRCLSATPAFSEEALLLARKCALSAAVRSDKVLAGTWAGAGSTLKQLREKMRGLGYMKAGAQWPWPARLPPAADVAEDFQAIWKEGKQLAKEARKSRNKVPSTTWWVMKEANKDLRALISLFILREPMDLAKAVELIGTDACKLLLERGALCCYSSKDVTLLEPQDAAKLTGKPSAGGPEVIANVALWPVEDDVLVAVDFEQADWQEGLFEPVMYLGEDSKSLVLAASRQAAAKTVLDVCCGSGAQGLAALKRSAEKATFLDSNPRALRFAAFGAALSGVEDRATFVEGCLTAEGLPKGAVGPFDAILAGLPFLPNPEGVVVNQGPAFKSGGFDGEKVLSAVMTKAPKLLSAGGSLTLTSMVRDVDAFAKRVKGWVGASSGYHATVFRGKAITAVDFAGRAMTRCTEAQGVAYYRGLDQVKAQTMSEAMVLLWAPAQGAAQAASKVDIRAERSGLWSDQDYLWKELERLLLAVGVASTEEPLYELDWADGKEAEEGDGTIVGLTPPSSSTTGKMYAPKVSKEKQKEFTEQKGMEGATWNDIVQVSGPGFSPPVLCDLMWSKVGGILKADKKAIPHLYSNKSRNFPFQWGLLEFQAGIASPETLMEALKAVGCRDRITFEGGAFNVQKDYLHTLRGQRREVKVSNYDVIVVPIVTKGMRATTPVVELPNAVLALMKVVMKQLKKRAKPARIVLVTGGCIGPSYVDGVGEQVPGAAPVLGLIRTMRKEVPQVPIIWLDSDELGVYGGQTELLSQMVFELDVATPKNGIWGVSTQERAVMLLSNNRDVAYRKGQRYLPKLDLSARMPIYVGCEVPALPRASAEGAILVTGGVAGLGLVVAETLAEAGAQCLVLSSKTGDVPKGMGVERRIQAMQERDVTVVVEKCDTSKDREVQKLLERVRSTYGSLTAVVHCAGLLANAPIDELDGGMMTHVFEPKAQGAYYLHKHTEEDDLLAFVMCSSLAALRGSESQANYAAACAYLDELARLRFAQGLAAVSVQWPGLDLSGRTVKDDSCVGLGTVKQVVRQLVCGREPVQPVQAVLPAAYLVASSPPVKSLLEPLLARGSPQTEEERKQQAEKPKVAQSERPKAPRVNW